MPLEAAPQSSNRERWRMPYRLLTEQVVPRPLPEVFSFFAEAENLEQITPKWLHFQVLQVNPRPIQQGTIIHYRLRLHGLPLRWTSKITEWNPPYGFADRQMSGPYRLWEHHHRFIAEGDSTRMVDDVSYELPLGPLGRLTHWLKVRRDVEEIFEYRGKKIGQRFGNID
jgi:ligand-binding SRPBCC domain-containing protein